MKVNVDKFLAPRKNPDFIGVQLSQEVVADNLTTELLGGEQFKKKRVAITTIAKSVIAKLGIKEGDDLSKKLNRAVKLQVIESLDEQPGFQAKQNPKTNEILKSNGKIIYRKTQLADATAQDLLIKHDVVTITAPQAV